MNSPPRRSLEMGLDRFTSFLEYNGRAFSLSSCSLFYKLKIAAGPKSAAFCVPCEHRPEHADPAFGHVGHIPRSRWRVWGPAARQWSPYFTCPETRGSWRLSADVGNHKIKCSGPWDRACAAGRARQRCQAMLPQAGLRLAKGYGAHALCAKML